MSANTLERKLAAPVTCVECKWLGRCGELISADTGLQCPKCRKHYTIKWIENEAPERIQ